MLRYVVYSTKLVRRVLVIDDSLDEAQALARTLEALGHSASFVINPLDALDAAEGIQAEVVFIDIDMPKVDGWHLARLLSSRFGGQALRLIAITGLDRPGDRLRSQRAGFHVHLVKPAPLKAIDDAVRGTHITPEAA